MKSFQIIALFLALWGIASSSWADGFNTKLQQLKNNVGTAAKLEGEAEALQSKANHLRSQAREARTAIVTPDELLETLKPSNLKFSGNSCQFESSYEEGQMNAGDKILKLKVTKVSPNGTNSEIKTWAVARLYFYTRYSVAPVVMALSETNVVVDATKSQKGIATISSEQFSLDYSDKLASNQVRLALDDQGYVIRLKLSDNTGKVIECGPESPVYY